jgi:hypothetical protein
MVYLMTYPYSIAFPGNSSEHSCFCRECEQVEQEHVEAGVAFDVADRCLQARDRVSQLDEFLRLHQAVLSQRQRLDSARVALDRHLQRHGKREAAQAVV